MIVPPLNPRLLKLPILSVTIMHIPPLKPRQLKLTILSVTIMIMPNPNTTQYKYDHLMNNNRHVRFFTVRASV